MTKYRSQFIVLSAPSGGGKTTIARALIKKHREMVSSVSATTRGRRPNENHGVDYFFLSKDEFEKNIENDNFLEYEEVHGNMYGTMFSAINDLIADGKVVVFDIDVNGALRIKKKYPKAILIFIKAPSIDELRKRLLNRKSESHESIQERLNRLPYEYEQGQKFDYIVINENLQKTISEIENIIIEK